MKFGEQEEPTGWAGPIAKDLGQGVQGLSSDLAKRLKEDGLLPKFEFSRGYLSLYAIMFGLGVVVAVLATLVATVKVAAAKGVDSRIMAQAALIRLLTFSMVGAMAPLLLAQVGELTRQLAGGFFDLAASHLASQLSWLAGALAVGTLSSLIVPGGSAVMVGLFLFLLAALAGIWLELAISHYLIFLLGLLIPILYGASINPDWRRGVQRVSGGLLGAFLAPAALFLVWVVAATAVAPWDSGNGFFTRAGVLIVGILLSLAAPIAIGLLLSYVVPAFAAGYGYEAGTVNAAVARVSQRNGRRQSPGPRASRSKRAADVTDEKSATPVESPTAAHASGAAPTPSTTAGSGASGAGAAGGSAGSGAGAAAAGPVAAAVGVWTVLVNKTRRTAEAARDAVGSGTRRADAAHQGDAEPDQPPTGRSGQGHRVRELSDQRPSAFESRSNSGAAPGGTSTAGSRTAGRRGGVDVEAGEE